jgi:hypothetical protein
MAVSLATAQESASHGIGVLLITRWCKFTQKTAVSCACLTRSGSRVGACPCMTSSRAPCTAGNTSHHVHAWQVLYQHAGDTCASRSDQLSVRTKRVAYFITLFKALQKAAIMHGRTPSLLQRIHFERAKRTYPAFNMIPLGLVGCCIFVHSQPCCTLGARHDTRSHGLK